MSLHVPKGGTMNAEKAGPSEAWGVRRLWGLADMINFVLTRFIAALKFIDQEIAICRFTKTHWRPLLHPDFEDDKKRALNTLAFVRHLCTDLALPSPNH